MRLHLKHFSAADDVSAYHCELSRNFIAEPTVAVIARGGLFVESEEVNSEGHINGQEASAEQSKLKLMAAIPRFSKLKPVFYYVNVLFCSIGHFTYCYFYEFEDNSQREHTT